MAHLPKAFLFLAVAISLSLMGGCASSGKKDQATLRALVSEGKYSQAITSLKESAFYGKKNSALLRFMELGLLHHAEGDYQKSIQAFDRAQEISQKLYTKRLSQKIEKWLINDDEDVYYGEIYERSLLFFYQALNHFLLAQRKGQNGLRANELQRARAELVAWSSFLDSLRDQRLGETVFKYDLLANVFGGFVHEMIGTSEDLETALTLYENALDVLFQNYNSYKTFNRFYEKFVEDFEKLPKLEREKVAKDYVKETQFQKSLRDFLLYRLLSLTWKSRGKSGFREKVSQLKKLYQIPADLLARVRQEREKLESSNYAQVAFLLQNRLIPEKTGEDVYIGLGKALRDPETSGAAKVGASVLTIFAADVLNLVPPPGGGQSPGETYMALNLTQVAVSEAAIAFEVPKIRYQSPKPPVKIRAYRLPDKKEVVEKDIPLVQPLGDIAAEAVAENASWRYGRVGTRLALKHALAIAASYGTYTALKGDRGSNAMAKSAALLQYAASTRAIQATEKADVRYWSTLPSSIRFVTFPLEVGKYEVVLVTSQGAEIPYGQVQIRKGEKGKLLNKRVP